MRPEDWRRIKPLLQSILECEPGQRAMFLEEACAGDEALRREIETLVACHEQAGSFFEVPAYELMAEILAADLPEALVGKEMGPYEILFPLGVGGMGEVYLAEDMRLGRKVALKILPPAFTRNEERLRRFTREAKAASALNHPNIITIYEVGQAEGGTHFIATEFIKGQTLRERMAGTRMRLSEVLDIATQVGCALEAAHREGIVHRDIKPENIMLRRDGYAKVLDFGLAKLKVRRAAGSGAARLSDTNPGVIMGTAQYMSPEQARGLEVDARTDTWSLGVVLYEMIAGRVPFEGATSSDVMASVLKTEPEPLTRRRRETPAELQSAVTKALAKDREKRYRTITELLADLRRLRQRLELEAELGRSLPPGLSGEAPAADSQSVVLRGAAAPASRGASTAARRRRSRKAIDSLATLPFATASDDPSAEYLSDGITESIINTLSQIPKLRVMARSTVFSYKGREADPQTIGRELGVRAVLTGRVLQVGDRFVVGAELVDTADGSQLWGEQYKRELSDIFEVQEEIAREISEELRLKLTSEEKKRLSKRYTGDAEAYHLYLKGRYHSGKFSREGLQRGVDYFNRAVEKDPDYALAYAGLAEAYGSLWFHGCISPAEAVPVTRPAALRALEIDPALAEARISLGLIKMFYDWDWSGAEREFRRAIDLNPGYAAAHQWYGGYLVARGRRAESLTQMRRALELDPLSLMINVYAGWHFYFAREYDKAIEQFHRAVELDANFHVAHEALGFAYTQTGRHGEGVSEFEKAIALSGGSPVIVAELRHAYALSGRRAEAQAGLDELKELSKQAFVLPYHIAAIHTGLGERDQAFEWLEKAYQEHYGGLAYVNVEPKFDSLRADPRFTDLVRRIGLAP